MDDFAPSSSLFSSPDNTDENENKVVPSSAAELPTASTTRGIRNVRTVLISSSIFCLFIRWGLPRLINLFNSNSPSAPVPETQIVADPTPGRPYDVFLNHRGPDVKPSLASLIYHWLEDKGLRVFLDQQEFLPGEELHPTIQQAISSASVHIAIFSKRYAESSWCLNELCSMLKSGAKIIPVFYEVQPYELRWIGKGKGVYVSAFARHRKKRRVPSQKLDEWKAALERVSYMHGLELNGPEFHGDMGKLLKSIANTVTEAVAEKVPLESAKDPVGLDDAVEDFQNFLQSEAHHRKEESVNIVGIVGFGGSGKTTLAKEFGKIQRTSFTASSFLSDVRHEAAQHKLQNLQAKLLKDLFHISDHSIERSSVSDGRAILSNKLRSSARRVLIILDDIDDENQVGDLLDKDVLGSGSLILMTSRDEGALRRSGADPIYKIKPLKSYHALELFCRHAFQQPRPKTGFEDLAEKFCGKCGGFPLFLKVIGAHLRDIGKDNKSVWSDELEYIPDGIKNILKFSYDALAIEEKQMFLDVACFFLGEDKSMAIRVWKGSDRRASTRLQNLESRCLVEVDDENCLKMHDHLRDFGREIAEQESCCRFWHPSQILNIREQLKGRREVRGIMASLGEFPPRDLRLNSTFEEIELSSLKFLSIEGDCFESRFEQQATNLMWLRWYHCPHTNFPSRFISMKTLTVLHIFRGILEEWEIFDSQLPLKELAIQDTRLSCLSIYEGLCPQLEYLDLSLNACLEKVERLPTTLELLDLGYCIKLKRISANFHLKKLKSLYIEGCCELEELPDLKHLTSLETFEASDCIKLQNIQGLEHLSKLRCWNVSECCMLREVPNLSGLTTLERLQARGCSKLQNIQSLEHLSKLRYLSVDWCSELGELPNLSGLTSLETLQASGCGKLQNIQGLEHLSKLRHLQVRQCCELGELPNLSSLTSLETLQASYCSKLQNIQGLEHLSKLRYLSVDWCSELGELPNLSGLTSLETLQASGCSKLQNIQGLEHLSKLRHLKVGQCCELGELPNLSGLTSLEMLQATGCSKLQNIQGLEHLSKLRYLSVDWCSELGELPNLSGLISLEMFQATGCSKLQNIQGLQHCSKVRHLKVGQCCELGELPNLSALTSLGTLQAWGCSKLQNIQGLEHLSKLRYLSVDWCSELGGLPNLSALTSLETLQALGCSTLQNIQGLERLSKLRYLDVSECCMLAELPNLSGLTSLETLQARGCSKLQNIGGLEHLSKLRHLRVRHCCELGELPDLSGLTSLETLQAWGCNKLQNIQGLEHLSKLRYLSIGWCSELGEVPNLSGLTSLGTLQVSGCSKLQNIQGLEHLSRLRHLKIHQCCELGELPNLSSLTSLETLHAWGCSMLQNIQGLEHLSKLRHLKVRQCCELAELPNLSGLTSLETLHARDCSKLQNIEGLEHLSKLRYLSVNWCSELGDLPNLSGLTSLETLQATGCTKLQNIQGLQHLSKLKYLNVNWCSELGELPNLSGLTSLEMLQASGCSKLQNIQGLEHLSKLRCLTVNWCFELGELPNLSSLTSLDVFQAAGCSKLRNIADRLLDNEESLDVLPPIVSLITRRPSAV